MSIQDWGAIGELIAAVATVGTLIYLASQIRQNTKQLRSTSYEAYNQAGYNAMNFIGDHAKVLAEIFEQALSLDQMTPEQGFVFSAHAFQMFNSMEATYLHWRSGALDDDVYRARVRGYAHFLADNPLLREYWRESAHNYAYTDDFIEVMNEQIVGHS